jgi:hypothetical protein
MLLEGTARKKVQGNDNTKEMSNFPIAFLFYIGCPFT